MASDIDEAKAGPAPGEADDQRRRWLDRLHLWALVELFVLSGFAIAQPLLDVTGKSPDFFLFRRADRLDIVLLVLGVTLLPALVIWAFEVAVGLVSETVRRLLHLAAIAGLFSPAGHPGGQEADRPARARAGGRRPGRRRGAGGVRCTPGRRGLRLWLRYLAPAPLVFALVFLLMSPTSKLVLPARTEATTGGRPRRPPPPASSPRW